MANDKRRIPKAPEEQASKAYLFHRDDLVDELQPAKMEDGPKSDRAIEAEKEMAKRLQGELRDPNVSAVASDSAVADEGDDEKDKK